MTSKAAEFETALANLNRWPVAEYRRWPVPSYLDGEIADMVLEFSNLPAPERNAVRQLINSPHHTCILVTFAGRMLRIGIDKKSEAGLYIATLALVIVDFQDTDAEGMSLLSTLVYEAAKFVADPKAFWSRVSGLASPRMVLYLDQTLAGTNSAAERLVA